MQTTRPGCCMGSYAQPEIIMLVSIGNVCNFTCHSTPSNLEDPIILEINKKHRFTHYFVCQTNRLRIKPETIKVSEEHIEFIICEQVNEFDWEENEFVMSRIVNGIKCNLKVEGKSITLYDSSGREEYFDNVFLFLNMVGSDSGWHQKVEKFLRLEVKYIGKTELTEKYIRFKGHEKIDKVKNEIIENRPNKEIIVKLLSFQKPFVNAMMIPEIQSDDSRSDWHPGGGLIENMPFEDWKSSVEGALIKYFQPEFNVHYKDNYPSNRHKSYRYFYDNNVRSIIVEVYEDYMAHITGNESVPYKRIRVIQYALNSDDSGIHLTDNNNQIPDMLFMQ